MASRAAILAAESLSYSVVPLTRMSLPLPTRVSPPASASDQDVAAGAGIGQRRVGRLADQDVVAGAGRRQRAAAA